MSSTGQTEPSVNLDDLASTWRTVQMARAKAKEWTSIADAAMATIKEHVGEAETGTIAGRVAIRHTTRTVTRVDSKKLRAELPEPVLAPYLNTTTEHRYELVDEQ